MTRRAFTFLANGWVAGAESSKPQRVCLSAFHPLVSSFVVQIEPLGHIAGASKTQPQPPSRPTDRTKRINRLHRISGYASLRGIARSTGTNCNLQV
jgi:hypothetical protein